jgi:hypothetical protein
LEDSRRGIPFVVDQKQKRDAPNTIKANNAIKRAAAEAFSVRGWRKNDHLIEQKKKNAFLRV